MSVLLLSPVKSVPRRGPVSRGSQGIPRPPLITISTPTRVELSTAATPPARITPAHTAPEAQEDHMAPEAQEDHTAPEAQEDHMALEAQEDRTAQAAVR